MDYQKLFDTSIKSDEITQWRASGKKALGIVCCHIPFELLHAAEVLPVRMRATGCADTGETELWIPETNCDFTKGMLQHLLNGTYEIDGVLCSNGCQISSMVSGSWEKASKARGLEQFFFEISAPKVSNKPAFNFFHSELDDLRLALEELTGNKITNEKLKASIEVYNKARRLIKQVYALHMGENPVLNGEDTLKITLAATEMPIEKYIDLLEAFLADAKNLAPLGYFGARVMLVGSALDDPRFVRAIEECGCLVVADLNSFGLRFLRDELKYEGEDMLEALTAYYVCRSSCPRMIDGSDSINDYILTAAKEFEIDGVIIERLKNCDKWESEAFTLGSILKDAGVPFLELERQETNWAPGPTALRVEAFREMLENKNA